MQGKTLRQFHHRSFLRDKKDFDKLVYLKIEFPYVPIRYYYLCLRLLFGEIVLLVDWRHLEILQYCH